MMKVESNHAVIRFIQKNLNRMRGRAKITKLADQLINHQTYLNLGYANIPLDLSRDADLGLFFNQGIKHERFFASVVKALTGHDDVLYDIGANLGFYTFLLSNTARKIYSIEANPFLSKRLESSVSAQRLDHINVMNIGLGDRESELPFYFSASQHNLGSFIKSPLADSQIIINSSTLDHLIDWQELEPPTIMKIDVEGFELNVLKGFTKLLQYKPIVLMEWITNESLEQELWTRLSALLADKYDVFAILRSGKLINFDGQISSLDSSDLLLMPQGHKKINIISKWIL